MFPASFDYYRAASVTEALDLLGRHAGARLLAGGHSLIPMMKLRLAQPPAVIDIGRIAELSGIRPGANGLSIGALTPHAVLAASKEVARDCPLLGEAAAKIGDPQVRNKGTIGGNIAHADPASDLPAVLVALGATIHARGRGGERAIPAGDFFLGLLHTDLRPDEILTSIDVPRLAQGTGSAYLKVEHPASGYALCGAAAVVTVDRGGQVTAASLAFNGLAEVPVRATAVAEHLLGTTAQDGEIERALGHLRVDEPLGDVHASGAYRVQLAGVYGCRAVKLARNRARG